MRRRRLRKRVVVTASLLTVLFVVWVAFKLAFAVLSGDSPNPFADPLAARPFDPKVWEEDAMCEDGSNRRGGMARDILDHRLKRGMTEAQVEQLLGPAGHVIERQEMTGSQRFTDEDKCAARILEYYLGEEIGIAHGVDRAWLYVYMDAVDRCTGGRIYAP